jgi:hypothetical protein
MNIIKIKTPIKIDFSFILFIVFLIISVLYIYKLNLRNNYTQIATEREKQKLYYKIDLLNYTLKENFKTAGTKLRFDHDFNKDLFINNQKLALLFLEKNACSDCYIDKIKKIISRLSHIESFLIVSHENNVSLIKEAKLAKQIIDCKVVWTNEDIHYNSVAFQNNSALLIVDNNKTILWVLPLEFINESTFFNEYITFLEKSL